MSLILNSSRSDRQQSSLFHFNEEQSLNDTQESKIPFEWGPSAAITGRAQDHVVIFGEIFSTLLNFNNSTVPTIVMGR